MSAATTQVFDALKSGLLDVDRLMEAVGQGIHKAKVYGADYEDLRPHVLLELNRTPEILTKKNPYAFAMTFAHRRAVDFLRQTQVKEQLKRMSYKESVLLEAGIQASPWPVSLLREKRYQDAVRTLWEVSSEEDLTFLSDYLGKLLRRTGAERTRYSRLQNKFEETLRRSPFRSEWLRLHKFPKIEHSTGLAAGGSVGIGPDPDTHPKPLAIEWTDGQPSRRTGYDIVKALPYLPACQRATRTPAEALEKIDKSFYFKRWFFAEGELTWQMQWRHPWHSIVSTPAIRRYLDWNMPPGNGGFGENCDENGDVTAYHPRSKKHPKFSYEENLYRKWAGLPEDEYLLSWVPRRNGTVKSISVHDDPDPSPAPGLGYKYKYGIEDKVIEWVKLANGVERYSAIALRKYNEVIEQINTPIRNPEPLALNTRTRVKVWTRLLGDMKYNPFHTVTGRARLTAGNNWVVEVDKRTVLVSSLDWSRKSDRKLAATIIKAKMQVIKGTTLSSGKVIPPKRLLTQPVGSPIAEKLFLSAVPESMDFRSYVPADCRKESGHWKDVGITNNTKISLLSPTHMRHSHYHVCDREARFCTAKGRHVLGLTKGVTLLDS
jgi:hypothetical protein